MHIWFYTYLHVLKKDWGRSNRVQGYWWPFATHHLCVRGGIWYRGWNTWFWGQIGSVHDYFWLPKVLFVQRQGFIWKNLVVTVTLSSSSNIHSFPNTDSFKIFLESMPFYLLHHQCPSSGCHPELTTSKLACLLWVALSSTFSDLSQWNLNLIMHPPWWNMSLTFHCLLSEEQILTWPIKPQVFCSSPTYGLIAHLPPPTSVSHPIFPFSAIPNWM